MSRNLLDLETSPYLLQHRANPVHWRPWGPAALAEAVEGNKPILLSVGYAACHWCHVMAHESFEDAEISRLMNDLFVPIKVDREERPDLDIIYQTALANLGQQGGWPLTMFLTPKGEPFWGGTYFPPTARFGRPGFRDVLTGVAEAYHREPEKISANVAALKSALSRKASANTGLSPSIEMLDRAALALLRAVDPQHGGLSGAPKFPQVSLFSLLWRAHLRNGDEPSGNAVLLTLDQMSQGGIYDHLGGGYARYSTDPTWLVPHFEKMLYDNAQLVDLLTLVWAQTRSALYQQRVEETIGWLAREMIAEHGAFAATLDADSEGEEGKYYVWREAEIDAALPPNLANLAKRVYAVSEHGNWEGVSILHRNHSQGQFAEDDEPALRQARQILLDRRAHRVPPGRDDKILADWNGMMIAALAQAGFVFDRPDWLAMATQAFGAICTHLVQDGRLVHSFRKGRRQAEAMLDDYAQMARAALVLYEVTGDDTYLDQSIAWVITADRHYWDDDAGGYFFTADDAEDLITRTKSAMDNATPSGNGIMVEVLTRLHFATGIEAYRQRAEDVVTAFGSELETSFPSLAALLNSWELSNDAVQVTILGPPHSPAVTALVRQVALAGLPNRVLSVLPPGRGLPPGHPAAQKSAAALPDQTIAYVCRGSVCAPPTSDPEALRIILLAR